MSQEQTNLNQLDINISIDAERIRGKNKEITLNRVLRKSKSSVDKMKTASTLPFIYTSVAITSHTSEQCLYYLNFLVVIYNSTTSFWRLSVQILLSFHCSSPHQTRVNHWWSFSHTRPIIVCRQLEVPESALSATSGFDSTAGCENRGPTIDGKVDNRT